jgi:hypothetical protein
MDNFLNFIKGLDHIWPHKADLILFFVYRNVLAWEPEKALYLSDLAPL